MRNKLEATMLDQVVEAVTADLTAKKLWLADPAERSKAPSGVYLTASDLADLVRSVYTRSADAKTK